MKQYYTHHNISPTRSHFQTPLDPKKVNVVTGHFFLADKKSVLILDPKNPRLD